MGIVTCSRCRREIEPGETTWPDDTTEDGLCQTCWEDHCGRSWWEMVLRFAADPEAEEAVN